jgi:hypothetical protein
MRHLEYSSIWCWNLDASGSRSETSGKFWYVVLEKISWIEHVRNEEVLSLLLLLFSPALQPSAGYGLLISRGFLITHNDALHSVGLFRKSDQLVAETSTWQHITHTADKHPCPRLDSNPDRSRRAAVDLRLTPRSHWDRHVSTISNETFM